MKTVLAALAAAMLASCATAKTECAPPPKDLVIKDLRNGTGSKAVAARTAVNVGYTGWLYDGCKADLKGKMFDTSEGRPVPFGFTVGAGKVIRGWDEGLVGMRERGKRQLVIPADKAYGARGAGDVIPPNAALVFEVELINIIYQPEQ